MGIKKVLGGVIGIGAAGVLGFSIFRAISAGPGDAPRQTDLEGAQRRASPVVPGQDFRQALGKSATISGKGIVEGAERGVKVGSRVPGLVQKIFVQEGDKVVAGQSLLELDSSAERAAVSTAKADLDGAVARLAISSLTARRAEELARDGAISRDERDRSVSAANIDRAGVDQARSRLSEASARLAQLIIKAPSVGTILKLSVRAGEFYSPEGGASLLTLGDLSKVRVRLDIDERFIGSVFVGQPGYVVVEAYGNRKFPGKVVEIAPQMGRKNQRTDDPTERIDTKIREVLIELDDAKELVPNLSATGYLSVTKLESSAKVARDEKGNVLGSAAASTSGASGSDAADRGAAAAAQGNWKEAVQAYEQALAGNPRLPNRAGVLLGLAGSHIELGQYTEGLERAQEAAALAPRDPEVPYWKARAYSGMGRFDEARSAAKAALDLDKNHKNARAVLRALDERAKGQPATAPAGQKGVGSLVATASVTTGARPATAEEWDRRGAALLSAGKQREAVAVYREAVMAQPALRTRVKDLAGQYKGSNLELAYCLDPSDATLATAWSKAGGPRRSLCAESK